MNDQNPENGPLPATETPGNHKAFVYFPFFLSVAVALGIWIGYTMNGSALSENSHAASTGKSFNKIGQILRYIESEYVDTVDHSAMVEKMVHQMLQSLDPHSYYIPPEDVEVYTEPIEGSFKGIGIEFLIQNDTVMVVNTIAGGPSRRLGIQPGDRIVKVNDTLVAGTNITNQQIMKRLKGMAGTEVSIDLLRRGASELRHYNIKRANIPIHSLDVVWQVNDTLGYIKVIRFSKNTTEEFRNAAMEFKHKNIGHLILDLRGNGGGVFKAATDMADEFLEKGKLIVFNKGKNRPEDKTFATGNGMFKNVKLAVLMDQNSASASEIVAGAIQDNDRGIIVGRRSFGKGLVQTHKTLPDGSAFRLSVSRYHTPTGRCIQKPYGNGIAYNEDYYSRLASGELTSQHSIPFPDSLRFVTPGGNIVYGGGGIIPDVFVPADTSGSSFYLSKLNSGGILNQFAFYHTDRNRAFFNAYAGPDVFRKNYEINDAMLEELATYAAGEGIPKDAYGFHRSSAYIRTRLKALIARNLFQNTGYFPVLMEKDPVFLKAMDALSGNL